MSEFRIDQISNQAGTAGPDIAGITTFSSTSGMLMPRGSTGYRYFSRKENIVENGLVLNLDAADTLSYPGNGILWKDVSSNGNDGTLINGPTYDSSNGGSIVFDGINDYVSLGTIINGVNGNLINFAANIWVMFLSYPTPASSNIYLPFGKYIGGQIGWEGVYTSTGGVQIYGRENSSLFISTPESATKYPINQIWYITYMKNNNVWSVYVNGNLATTITSGSGSLSVNAFTDLTLGRAEGAYYANCKIYSAQLYNRGLTQQEILQNFNALRSRYGV